MALVDTEKLIKPTLSIKKKLIKVDKLLERDSRRDSTELNRNFRNKEKIKRKEREQRIEKGNPNRRIIPKFSLPRTGLGIWDTIKRFLGFTFAAWLINFIKNMGPLMDRVLKMLPAIGKGLDWVGKWVLGGVITFIESVYGKYDEIERSIEEIGGKDAKKKFQKFSGLFNKVLNGAIILAMASTLLPRKPTPPIKPKPLKPTPHQRGKIKPKSGGQKGPGGSRRTGSLGDRLRQRFRRFNLFRRKPNISTSGGRSARLGGRLRNIFRNPFRLRGSQQVSGDVLRRKVKVDLSKPLGTRTISGMPPSGSGAPVTKGRGGQLPADQIDELAEGLGKAISDAKLGKSGKPGFLKNITEFLKNIKIPIPKWLTTWKGNALINGLLAYWEYWTRRQQGQSEKKALVGTGASTIGGFAGFWAMSKIGAATGAKMGVLLGPKGALIGGVVGGLLFGIAGAMGGSHLAGSGSDALMDRIEGGQRNFGPNYKEQEAALFAKAGDDKTLSLQDRLTNNPNLSNEEKLNQYMSSAEGKQRFKGIDVSLMQWDNVLGPIRKHYDDGTVATWPGDPPDPLPMWSKDEAERASKMGVSLAQWRSGNPNIDQTTGQWKPSEEWTNPMGSYLRLPEQISQPKDLSKGLDFQPQYALIIDEKLFIQPVLQAA